MENANTFREKITNGDILIGPGITFSDPTVTEALCNTFDFVWIDMEHNPLSLEKVQGHIIATRSSDTTALVRVTWNDPAIIKPVLDIGADGVIVPWICSVEEAERAVKACLYPPEGIRGYGPRRPSRYGREGGTEFCRKANETVIVLLQLEHIDAINNLDEILDIPGLSGITVGPNDLSGSMGLMAQPQHPDVVSAIETTVSKARQEGVMIGMPTFDANDAIRWIEKGVQWVLVDDDYGFLTASVDQIAKEISDYTRNKKL